jgi:cytochrome c oxidase assembly factor CtaG
MSPTLDAFLRSWPCDPWLLAALGLTAAIYLRGWISLHRRDPHRWATGRLGAFLGGLAALGLALASPIEPFAGLLLQVHMVQHLLLMMAAPPLIWLGAPQLPLILGLPGPVRTGWVVPLLHVQPLRRLLRRVTHPAWALLLFVAATWLWHLPPVYEAALRSSGLHHLQHACFLASGLLFWYPVVRPDPARPRWSPWLLFPYLILADVSNTVLSALLTFSDRVLYAHYARMPRLGGLSALDDQSVAGVLMWVPGSLVFLLPLFAIGLNLLFGTATRSRPRPRPIPVRSARPTLSPRRASARWDLLRLPLLGRFLGWRHARLVFQVPLAVLAAVLIVDGLRGPQVGALNLAGVLPWIHWRGLVVLGLLAAGNVSCTACPFLLPRTLARRWLPARLRWPRALRNKWPALVLLLAFFWAYEAFSLWDRPQWTAGIIIGYFVAALVVDGVFRGAAFCKHVCPIGQFNFVQSQVSPLEVTVLDAGVCATCRTRDCIRGRDGIAGCELGLFQPRKLGNLDCTFCLDCIHACPHQNVGIIAGIPGRGLLTAGDRLRSGIGRLSRRRDLAALVLVVVFGGFASAAAMLGPVLEWQDRVEQTLNLSHSAGSALFLLALVGLPFVLHGAAAALSRRWGRLETSGIETATRFAYALVPVGFGMWLAHASFHLLTSYGTAIPAAQRFSADLGWPLPGGPQWSRACCRPVPEWLLRLEIVFLDLGMLLSLYTAHHVARDLAPPGRPGRALKAFAPWALWIVLLFAAGVWIVFQPMQMRGTLPLTLPGAG